MQATPAWDRERVVRRLAPAVPVALSLGAWAAGSGAVLRHVLLADDFVSAEIRRHGLVTELLRTLAAFSLPYLVAGLAAAWVARGLVRLVSPRPSPPGARDAWLGGVITVCLLGTAVLFALVERPANFAGIFWQRGGALRSVHRVAEAWTTPAGIAWGTGFVAAVAFAAASVGWWRHAPAGRRRASVVTLGLMVAAFASAPLTWRPGSGADPSRPNVLVLVVDSLRPDRLDGSTAAMGVAPALYAVSSGAVRFTNARTPSALTYPSMTSLLTALHPTRHGIRSHYPSDSERALTVETLPKRLRAAGWSTIAVGGYCSTVLREVDFGFDHYRLPRSEVDLIVSAVALRGHPWLPSILSRPSLRSALPQVRPAVEGSHPEDLTREAIGAWRRAKGPFFLTVFYDNPHLPYIPVWPHTLRTGSYEGPNRYALLSGNLEDQIRQGESDHPAHHDEAERANGLGLYDGAVRSVDRAIGDLLETLEQDGLSRDTIVVILADHGENLLDFGGPLAHGEAVERDGSHRIPWWIIWPGRLPARVVSKPVVITDVGPTILDLLGLPPLESVDGVSRLPEARGNPGTPESPALFETGMWFFARDAVDAVDPSGQALAYPDFNEGLLTVEPGDPLHVVVAEAFRQQVIRAKHRRLEYGVWALTYVPRDNGIRFRLFRTDRDPGLMRDVAEDHPEVFEEMKGRFYQEVRRLGASAEVREEERFQPDPAPSPTISRPAREIQAPALRGSVSTNATSISLSPSGTERTIRP